MDEVTPMMFWGLIIGGLIATIGAGALMFACLHKVEPYPTPREFVRKFRTKK